MTKCTRCHWDEVTFNLPAVFTVEEFPQDELAEILESNAMSGSLFALFSDKPILESVESLPRRFFGFPVDRLQEVSKVVEGDFSQYLESGYQFEFLIDIEDVDFLAHQAGKAFDVNRFFYDPLIPTSRSRLRFRNWISNVSFSHNVLVLIATFLGERIGCYVLRIVEDSCHLELNFIFKNAQGKGHGKRLMKGLVFFLSSIGIKQLSTSVSLFNGRALRQYEGLGFELERTRFVYHVHTV